MASSKCIVLAAALGIALATGERPAAAQATTPCCGTQMTAGYSTAMIPGYSTETIPALEEQEILGPITEYLRLKNEILTMVRDTLAKEIVGRAMESRQLEANIAALVDQALPKQQRESGGVPQLHPVRGTFLVRKDYAQETLEEDWFLAPQHGMAALHLEVPYDAEVTITPSLYCKETKKEKGLATGYIRLHSRGGHRDLVLTGLDPKCPRRVCVTATLRREPPKGTKYESKTKDVYLLAGDRRHLAFSEDDFREVDTTLPSMTTATAVSTTVTTSDAERSETGEGLVFEPAKLRLKIKFDADSRVVKELIRVGNWPAELKLIHNHGFPPQLMPDARGVTFAARFELFRGSTPVPSRIVDNPNQRYSEDSTMDYKSSSREKGELALKLDAKSKLWLRIDQELKTLTFDDQVTQLKLVGFVKFRDQPNSSTFEIVRVQDPLEISIESEKVDK